MVKKYKHIKTENKPDISWGVFPIKMDKVFKGKENGTSTTLNLNPFLLMFGGIYLAYIFVKHIIFKSISNESSNFKDKISSQELTINYRTFTASLVAFMQSAFIFKKLYEHPDFFPYLSNTIKFADKISNKLLKTNNIPFTSIIATFGVSLIAGSCTKIYNEKLFSKIEEEGKNAEREVLSK